jgi:hypothetical protein
MSQKKPKPNVGDKNPFARFADLARRIVAVPKEKASKDDSKASES